MSNYEYKTVALPRTVDGRRRNRKQSEAELVAELLGKTLNDEAVDGWEYVRAETLVAPGRGTLLKKGDESAFVVLIFRRIRRIDWRAEESGFKGNAPMAPTRVAAPEPARVAEPEPDPAPAPAPAAPVSPVALEGARERIRHAEPAPAPQPAAPRSSETPGLRIASTSVHLVSSNDPEDGNRIRPLGPATE